MRNVSVVGRTAAMTALLIAVIAIGVVLLGGGDGGYTVRAHFQNASQLVKGNLVQVSGKPVGEVKEIDLSENGEAEITLTIKEDYAPLRKGTLATVRASSLSGIANRYIDLRLPPATASAIADGGTIAAGDTTTAVDLDELFNVFGEDERKALTRLIRGFGDSYAGEGQRAREGWKYLNPSLAATSRLFRELNFDTALFERFIVASSKLVTDVADRRDDLAQLIPNLAETTGALGRQRAGLAEAIGRLPGFMRRANTTFVNLRSTLDDLDPLVEESKPVAKKLGPFLAQLEPFAAQARPTLRTLNPLLRTAGRDNDLTDLTNRTTQLAPIAARTVDRNGKTREGALPASAKALAKSTPMLSFARPYAIDLTGWFDDYSHSGVYDALGGSSRVAPHANAYLFSGGGPDPTVAIPIAPNLRAAALDMIMQSLGQGNGQRQRCPGSAEHVQADGSVPYKPSADFPCDENQVLPGL